jgi:xanthine dehydrogenase YagT iron-sulfur-binding subunit
VLLAKCEVHVISKDDRHDEADAARRILKNTSSPSQQEPVALHDNNLTRRQFVTAVGTITGSMALRIPDLDNMENSIRVTLEPQQAVTGDIVPVELFINGRTQKVSLDPRVTLLDLLRDTFNLTGTKKGCDHGQCGACTVLVNDVRINSCLTLAVTHDGDHITTIEGLAKGGQLHPIQAAFLEHDGFQCGYCTSGQICSAVALLREAQNGDISVVTQDLTKTGPAELTDADIRERMSGNICRCGAYPGIFQAVQAEYAHKNKTMQSKS